MGKGGVVREQQLQLQVVAEIQTFAHTLGLEALGVIPSPILGPKGNQEYLLYLHY